MAEKKERILGIFAHADDEVICGWPVMQDRSKERYLLTICDKGERGFSLSMVCNEQGIRHVEHHLEMESRFSLDPTGTDRLTVARLIAEAILDVRPDKIVTHNEWGEYGHPDHVLLSQLVRNYVTIPVLTSNLKMPSLVWLRPKANGLVTPDGMVTVERDEQFWESCKQVYGKHWTTNEYINAGWYRSAMVFPTVADKQRGPMLPLVKKLVVWVCDSVGWAFNNQAAALAGELRDYAHRVVFIMVYRDSGKLFYTEEAVRDMKRADVIVAMTPAAMRTIPERANVVTRVSGVRSV